MPLALIAGSDPRFPVLPSPSPSPVVATPSPRTLRDSIDTVLDDLDRKRDPCRDAKVKGVPCFPVTTVIHGRPVAVRDTLGSPLPDNGFSPDRPPSKTELAPYRPHTARPNLVEKTIDPGCVGKSALKRLKGKNDTYYLYRIHDGHGARVAMYDHRLEPNTAQGDLEFLGKFQGECDALAAYDRESRKRPPAPARSPSPSPGPSATPRP